MFSSNAKTLPLLVVATGLILLATDVMAQGPGGRGRGGRGGGGQGRGGIQALLQREDVQRELEITDDQMEELRELGQNRGDRSQREKMREELEGLSDDERQEKLQEMRQKRTEDQKAQLGEVLLPQQIRRLEQLTAQFTVSAAGGQAMFRGAIAEQLGLTEKQKEELQEKAEELQKEYNKRMAKLRKEMQEELLEELSPEQRKKFHDMMGESFEFEQTQGRGGRGGGRGGEGRGGRGGRGGGEGGRGGRNRNRGEDF